MELICKKTDLLNSVNIVLKAISTKSTLPILECLIIEAKENQIKLITNDMELGIETYVQGIVAEVGCIALNAKIFSEIIRKLPDNEINIKTDVSYNTTITCEKSKFNIIGKSSEEFPFLPNIEKESSVIISQFTLKEIIRQTVFSITDNDSNKIMTGELFDIQNNILKVVSLDGFRVSIRKIELKNTYDEIKVIVPGKTLNEISKIISGGLEDDIYMYFTDKHVVSEFDQTTVVSRLIEGEFFKIEHMLANDYETKTAINKKEFLNCIDRATLLVRESEKKPIIIEIKDNTMKIKINSTIGSMKEEINIRQEGKDLLIGSNPKYLMDALHVIDDEEIEIYFFNSKAPCFIKDKNENYIYLILPVNFNIND